MVMVSQQIDTVVPLLVLSKVAREATVVAKVGFDVCSIFHTGQANASQAKMTLTTLTPP
jgi:acetolactate synthase regulatory subunit